MKCQVDAIQWGGSSRIFPWSPKADAIQWGRGVVAEFFRGLQKPTRFSGGGGSTRNFPLMGPFYIFGVSQRGGPPPPLNRPLGMTTWTRDGYIHCCEHLCTMYCSHIKFFTDDSFKNIK